MAMLELPHTAGCVVCGPANARGLHLSLYVDPATGVIETRFVPANEHIGFTGIVHGGIIGAVIDEAMVWAASWQGKRFCVCGEMSVRFRQSAKVGSAMIVRAKVELSRAKLIATSCEASDQSGKIIATGTGKYVPLSVEDNREFVRTFVDEPSTANAARILRSAAN
jgi:uncharacterized protein (TIGR00369 family)